MVEETPEAAVVDNRDYAADVAPAFNSYDIVVAMRAIAEADRTEENYDADTLHRNEGHLRIKMAIPAFVTELSSEQKTQIEALSL
tara:strand:- start:351 stop:605 length:255 start_codon:yes stop_codon:yes gene_type:complete